MADTVSMPGASVEIRYRKAEHQRATLLFWPCIGGAFQMYRFPAEAFLEAGFSSVLYNPRGHGNSGGLMRFSDAMSDIAGFLRDRDIRPPLVGIGHSAGTNSLLHFDTLLSLDRLYLVSPVLDSNESLRWMYANGAIKIFLAALTARESRKGEIMELLSGPSWLDSEAWDREGLRGRLDALSGGFLLGSFLEDIFVPGRDARQLLAKAARKCEVVLPASDDWYPLESTRAIAGESGVDCFEPEWGRDHFFTGAWDRVWTELAARLSQRFGAGM